MAWLSGQSYNTSCCVLYVLKTRQWLKITGSLMQQQWLYDLIMSGITFRHWVNLKLALRFHALLIVTILSLWRAHSVTIVIIWGETYLCLWAIRRGIPSPTNQWGLYSVCAALFYSLAGTAKQLSTSAVTITMQTILHILPEVYMKCIIHFTGWQNKLFIFRKWETKANYFSEMLDHKRAALRICQCPWCTREWHNFMCLSAKLCRFIVTLRGLHTWGYQP